MKFLVDPTRILLACLVLWTLGLLPSAAGAESTDAGENVFNLDETVQTAIDVNLDLEISRDEIQAAQSAKKARRAAFLPRFSTTYQYIHNYEERRSPFLGITTPENQHTIVGTVTQPLFTGFSLINQYNLAEINLKGAHYNNRLIRRDIVFQAKQVFFQVLKAQKLLDVSRQTVRQLEAQVKDAKNFYEVGMTPLNDLLQVQVQLANAQQSLLVAENTLKIAVADFNTLLRRPLGTPVTLAYDEKYLPLVLTLPQCLQEARQNRIELDLSTLEIRSAEKQADLARSSYYPTISIEGNYYKIGTDWSASGGPGVADPNSWDIQAVATWTFFEWGRTYYNVRENVQRIQQQRKQKEKILDQILFEVKQAYLRASEAEQNIETVKKAIVQAEENFRINKERYKEQVATSTDVLNAQTLLSQTMTNYYTALYDFATQKAALYRAMGFGQGGRP